MFLPFVSDKLADKVLSSVKPIEKFLGQKKSSSLEMLIEEKIKNTIGAIEGKIGELKDEADLMMEESEGSPSNDQLEPLRGDEYLAFSDFLKEHGVNHYCGLIRICDDETGNAMWVSESSKEKIMEEREKKKLLDSYDDDDYSV